jgi:hypothetical protein
MTVLAVMDCGHDMLILNLEQIPQEKLPFDKKKALTKGTAHIPGPCPSCSGVFGKKPKGGIN